MKKLVYSSIVAFLIVGASAVGVSAATNSLIGKKVQNIVTVTVNGKTVKDAVVIDGTTYAPVRSFSEAAGYSISIDKGGVNLSSQTEAEIIEQIQTDHRLSTLRTRIVMWEAQLVGEKETAELARNSIKKIADLNANSSAEAPKIDDASAKEKLANAEAAISELQAQIDAANAEIAQLQAQLGK